MSNDNNLKKSKAPLIVMFASSIAAFLLLVMSGGSMYTVDQGERGVVLHYGEVSKVADPGLHFKMPYGAHHPFRDFFHHRRRRGSALHPVR